MWVNHTAACRLRVGGLIHIFPVDCFLRGDLLDLHTGRTPSSCSVLLSGLLTVLRVMDDVGGSAVRHLSVARGQLFTRQHYMLRGHYKADILEETHVVLELYIMYKLLILV